ncbi:MAG TPA: FUSC family protein [Paenibacillus cookii]|nr:FUSC family protein [Paenibacillus cookii]
MSPQKHHTSLIHSIVRQALEIKKAPLPWGRAVGAGISLGLPSLIGLLAGRFDYGLLAGTGGFTYLYASNEPYFIRSRKLAFVMLGIAFSVFCGSLLSTYPVLSGFVMGLIGAVVTFVFGALKFKGPAALFFVLSFAIASGTPHTPSEAAIRGTLVLLGGALAWLIAMAGWLTRPHGPEMQAIRRIYAQLADMMEAVGTRDYEKARHETLIAMLEGEPMFAVRRHVWKETELIRRLERLFNQAHVIYQETDTWQLQRKEPPPDTVSSVVRSVSGLGTETGKLRTEGLMVPDDAQSHALLQSVLGLSATLEGVPDGGREGERMTGTPLQSIFLEAFDKNSLVFLLSLRFGIILTFAALAAHAFNLNRSYWVPLSCAAVMLGSTVIATFHRAIQRSLGTMIGILAASAILWAHPQGIVISLAIMLFSFFAELLIVRNYTLTMMFVTPNALLMAAAGSHIEHVGYFAGTRMVDVVTGSLIGLAGVLILGRTSASSRIPYLMGRAIRSQSQLLAVLFTGQIETGLPVESREQRSMKTRLANLTTVYATALGELPRNEEELQRLLPVVWALEQFAYLLNSYSRSEGEERPGLSDPELACLLLWFEKMAQSADRQRLLPIPELPGLEGIPKVRHELSWMQTALEKSLAS